jgi:hypothetical protein
MFVLFPAFLCVFLKFVFSFKKTLLQSYYSFRILFYFKGICSLNKASESSRLSFLICNSTQGRKEFLLEIITFFPIHYVTQVHFCAIS